MRNGSFETLQTRGVAIRTVGMFLFGVLIGCRASTENVMTYGGQLPRPQRIVVYDFHVDIRRRSSTIWSRG